MAQPICPACYDVRYPGRKPVGLKPEYASVEQCCDCNEWTRAGIYVRAELSTMRYPSLRRDPDSPFPPAA